jgi:flagellar basal body-associated protein FliL
MSRKIVIILLLVIVALVFTLAISCAPVSKEEEAVEAVQKEEEIIEAQTPEEVMKALEEREKQKKQ